MRARRAQPPSLLSAALLLAVGLANPRSPRASETPPRAPEASPERLPEASDSERPLPPDARIDELVVSSVEAEADRLGHEEDMRRWGQSVAQLRTLIDRLQARLALRGGERGDRLLALCRLGRMEAAMVRAMPTRAPCPPEVEQHGAEACALYRSAVVDATDSFVQPYVNRATLHLGQVERELRRATTPRETRDEVGRCLDHVRELRKPQRPPDPEREPPRLKV